MSGAHRLIGFAVVGTFALGWIWGLGVWVLRRGPGGAFWNWLTFAQVVAGIEAIVGIVLLLLGDRPTTWLHYVYGFGPIALLVVAHVVARRELSARPWVPFAWASFFCFGLSLRALMTGLGVG
jgi:hypothetical protein